MNDAITKATTALAAALTNPTPHEIRTAITHAEICTHDHSLPARTRNTYRRIKRILKEERDA